MKVKHIIYGVLSLMTLITIPLLMGINEAGKRTVVQYPSGTLFVKFDGGWYPKWFGSTEVYNDVLTYDFTKSKNGEGTALDQSGIPVRYQDGGEGRVFGIARIRLPNDQPTMLKVHKDFRSNNGIAHKILKNTTEEVGNHTAGLMTSEQSYAEKRGEFTQQFKTQMRKGKYHTVQDTIVTVENGMEFCLEEKLTPALKKECKDVKKTTKFIPVIAENDMSEPIHESHDFDQYGITQAGFNLVDWSYEPKTLKQISDKRDATMGVITAKANADLAKQNAITAEQKGLENVMVAKYEKEEEKIRAVVDAERVAEVAVINAKQKVDVAEQEKLAEVERKLQAYETKKKLIALGQGEAKRQQLVMEASGMIHEKLATYEKVSAKYAEAIGKQKWTPEINMGGTGGGTSGAGNANALIDMFTAKTAKDLSLDMSMKTK